MNKKQDRRPTQPFFRRPVNGMWMLMGLLSACASAADGDGQTTSESGVLVAPGSQKLAEPRQPAEPAPAAAAAAPSAPADDLLIAASRSFGCTPPPGLVTDASLWKVKTKPFSYWTNLAPWAFWSVDAARPRLFAELGSHNGYSYFAFAQAMQQRVPQGRAYAIDLWQGDEHAGAYDDGVYQEFMRYHDAHYSSFSTALKMTFDDALAHVADGSVDLLHIDGQHHYEDVDHDFRTWLPKLSERAVVLFHDVDVVSCGFGVHRWWAEMTQHYPSFTFHQEGTEDGLGLLGVGKNLPAAFQTLFGLKDPADIDCVNSIYSQLGVEARQHQVDP